jgi:hypothetical protein
MTILYYITITMFCDWEKISVEIQEKMKESKEIDQSVITSNRDKTTASGEHHESCDFSVGSGINISS